MENREPGVPKTEEERVAAHVALYGTSELPPRGSGQNPQSIIERAAELTIRAFDESMRADDELNLAHDGALTDLAFERVKPGRQMIMEHLVGYNAVGACTYIRVGYWNGHRYNWLNTQPAPLVQETVGVGVRVRLREGMWPVVRFEGGGIGDDLYAALNGYWIKTR